jgi:cysteine desulfurase/selenocysteine lyase
MIKGQEHNIREDFPIFSSKEHQKNTFIYFDSAATTQKPKCVIEAMMHFYLHEYGTVHRAIYDVAAKATQRYQATREIVRQFINAQESEEIVFTSGTTDSINLVAKSFAAEFLQEGDEIILSHAEHHANLVPWQMLALEKKVILKIVPISDRGDFDLQAYRKLLNKKTKLVSVAYMTNTTGTIYPVDKIIQEAHHIGAKVLLDAAQAIGHLRVDVQALDVDFLAFSAHKIYGPTGVGVLYGKKALLKQMPPHKGGGDMIKKVTLEKTFYQTPPLRFEAGTPMIAEVVGMGVAIEYLRKIGLDHIEQFGQRLLKHATKKMRSIPHLHILGTSEEKGPIITFVIDRVHSLDLGTFLNLKGVCVRTGQMCAEPLLQRFGVSSALRISFGIYNTIEEIDRFIELLQESLILLKPEMTD